MIKKIISTALVIIFSVIVSSQAEEQLKTLTKKEFMDLETKNADKIMQDQIKAARERKKDILKRVEVIFNEIDTNKDGKITVEEQKTYQTRVVEFRKNLMQLADTNKDNKISNKEMQDAIKKYDLNKDNILSEDEVKKALKK
jgi:Ca2+-binding EF-hand superfamily protein